MSLTSAEYIELHSALSDLELAAQRYGIYAMASLEDDSLEEARVNLNEKRNAAYDLLDAYTFGNKEV